MNKKFIYTFISSLLFTLSAHSIEFYETIKRTIAIVDFNKEMTSKEKADTFKSLLDKSGKLENEEGKMWNGLLYAVSAKYIKDSEGSLEALKYAKKSKSILEDVILKNRCISNGEALNGLAMLYYKTPGFPIAFGSDKEAEKYFNSALACSKVNPDIYFRYGEYLLLEKNKKEQSIKYLNKAINLFQDRDLYEDSFKIKAIQDLLMQSKENE